MWVVVGELLRTDLPKQVVVQRYPYANIGAAALLHAKNKCDLSSFDFSLGCSTLEILSAERKTGKKDRAPFLLMKVPGTNIVRMRYSLNFGQDYSVLGFQFERLMTGKELGDRSDASLTEHVQSMKIGNFRAILSAEVDAMDENDNPVEIKLKKCCPWVQGHALVLPTNRQATGRLWIRDEYLAECYPYAVNKGSSVTNWFSWIEY